MNFYFEQKVVFSNVIIIKKIYKRFTDFYKNHNILYFLANFQMLHNLKLFE